MNRFIVALLLLAGMASGQEIRRPTANAVSTASTIGCTGTNFGTTVTNPANWYDTGTPPTTTSGTSVSTAISTATQRWNGQVITGWALASGSYSSLTGNINMSCASSPYAGWDTCFAVYSLNAGSTWSGLGLAGSGVSATGQTTYSVTIPSGTVLSNIQVAFCSQSLYDSDNASNITTTLTIWDIWTSGILGASIYQPGLQVIGSNRFPRKFYFAKLKRGSNEYRP